VSVAKVISIEQAKKKEKEKVDLIQDFRQALKVINAEYQRIDWEERDFLSRVLNKTIEGLEEGRLP
jgi:tRNA U34 2-thiouridine synthase MnmA/TrmU